ncbi:FtsK/SpoIIIE-like protein [Mycobacterium phage Omega]|uniref:FtsK domain-containing protein n=1 Tax=Mycobacterium phage Omega TaxID=2907835 RepID=Q853W3_BPMOM|nr:FtsK/SpoIIIE-like protein [Mycobacterium phage Omega]AAN12845.1 hypothetical protein PBI_OMEGA_203 [Mycobacterium phage Omega]
MTAMLEQDISAQIISALREFDIEAKVTGRTDGPSVTRYEITLGPGVRIQKVAQLQSQLAYALATESVRVVAPIPGKTAVGIELPRPERQTVRLQHIVPEDDHPLTVAVGKDVEGKDISLNLAKMPHLLVAGATGSGKSSFINSMLVSLLYRATPDRVKLIMIDPKCVELTPYNGIPHLLQPVVTEADEAVKTLRWLTVEMDDRYRQMQEAGVRHAEKLGLPYIVVVVDELADLMMGGYKKEVEANIVRIAQKARAAGIHLVLATQRPSVDVVTGLIKSNVPSRLSFATASLTDSRVILDEGGAEQLMGMGDGLFLPVGARSAIRIQGAFVSDGEIEAAVNNVRVTARVEEKVRELNPEPEDLANMVPVKFFLDQLIETAEMAGHHHGGFLTEMESLEGKYLGRNKKLDMFTRTPEMLGHAADTLLYLAGQLKVLRDQALREI